MALGLTQPLPEVGTRNISWGGKGGRCVGLTTLPPSCADCVEIWELRPLEPSGPVQACNGIVLPLLYLQCTCTEIKEVTVTRQPPLISFARSRYNLYQFLTFFEPFFQ